MFESKGDLGMFCNAKRNVMIPQEFHFATDERIPPPPTAVTDLFEKVGTCMKKDFSILLHLNAML